MTRNYLSGSIKKGFPSTKQTSLVGESGSGKTFLTLNAVRNAQLAGYTPIYYDTEGAVDPQSCINFGIDLKNWVKKTDANGELVRDENGDPILEQVYSVATGTVPGGWSSTTTRINRTGTQSGAADPTKKRFRIVVSAQAARSRQRTAGSTYLVSGKDMSSQMKYIHSRGGKILSITEVM